MSNTENSYSETDLGNVSPNPRGEYDPETSYEYLDLVNYKGGSYLCLADLGTTATGIAPAHGKNTDTWQLLTLPGDLTPEYIAMHDDVANKAKQVEASRAAVEKSQEEIEAGQADVQQLHSDTVEAAQKASDSRDSAAGYAQAAETSRQAAAESEQNVNAQITGFDTHVSESVTQAQKDIAATRQQAIRAVASQQVTSTQAVKDQTASYITEKETSAKTEIENYTSEKVAEINNKVSEANITLANTIADGTSLKTQLEATISTADTSKKNLDASDTAAGKTKTALDVSNTTATKTKADLDASNTTASEAKTELDATNKIAADLVVSLRDKITEGTRVKTDIQTTGETAMSNLQTEATKQQEYIKTSIDDTLSISGKAADAAVTGKKINSLKEDVSTKITKFYASNQGETHITDSDNGKIQDMMLYGKSEQFTTTGKNLLKIIDGTQTARGITVTAKDGVVALKGTATETGWAIFDIDSFVLDGTYILSSNISTDVRTLVVNKSFESVLDQGKSVTLENAEVSKVCFIVTEGKTYDISNILIQIEKGSVVTSYEPYTGGIPSPSPDYPQEIKSVVNPTVKLSNEDGTKSQTVTLPYTLNAIPVSSGGNVTIDGQQYIADYVDAERGKLVRMVDTVYPKSANDMSIYTGIKENFTNYRVYVESADKKGILSNMLLLNHNIWSKDVCGVDIIEYDCVDFSLSYEKLGINSSANAEQRKIAVKTWLENNDLMFMYTRRTSNEIDLTLEEVQTFKALATYYPVTNISVNSEQLDGYTVFNYPISLANGWNYVKQQLNDNRDYIYDMDLQSAESYVNSEYAVALTELEV